MNKGSIVADESVDFRIVTELRRMGFEVHAIAEALPSTPDKEVLQIAVQQTALLLTEDKDFGELVFRFQLPHNGILLIRVLVLNDQDKIALVTKSINDHFKELSGVFSVLTDKKLRIKK